MAKQKKKRKKKRKNNSSHLQVVQLVPLLGKVHPPQLRARPPPPQRLVQVQHRDVREVGHARHRLEDPEALDRPARVEQVERDAEREVEAADGERRLVVPGRALAGLLAPPDGGVVEGERGELLAHRRDGAGDPFLPPLLLLPGAGRLAERGDMVTVHYTLYEEVLADDPSSSGPAPASSSTASSSSSSSSPAGGDAEAAAPAPAAVVVEDPAKKKKYRVLDSSRREEDGREGEPLTFEVGAGDVFGNELFQAFDEVVRGRAAGDVVRLTCPSPPAWDPELLFRVPGDHPEVERMRGRYKNVGGLAEGLVVELSNGKRAVVVAVSEEEVTLDANDMLAGGSGGERVFELELVRVEVGKKNKEGDEEEAA